MSITTLQEAFARLKEAKPGVPFDAITFIRNHPASREITDVIIYSLTHAFDRSVYYNEKNDYYSLEPIWYGIIAENHISETLIDPVINFYLTDNKNWEALNEQVCYLLGILSETYPDIVPERVLSIIENAVNSKSNYMYSYLFDAFYYLNSNKNKDRLLALLDNKHLHTSRLFALLIGDLQIKEAIPIIKKILNERKLNTIEKRDFEEALAHLESGINKNEAMSHPFNKQRKEWLTHYQSREAYFHHKCGRVDYSDNTFEKLKQQIKRWTETFKRTSHFTGLDEDTKLEASYIIQFFAELMYSDLLLLPEYWHPAGVEECCVNILPRIVASGPSFFESTAPVLAGFFAYLVEERNLDNASELVEYVLRLHEKIIENANDPSVWDADKTDAMPLILSSIGGDLDGDIGRSDPLSEDFSLTGNTSKSDPVSDNFTGSIINTSPKVGRNDPCPCGSGKKYKKCCL